jgi:cell wall assembly regulator SMI1
MNRRILVAVLVLIAAGAGLLAQNQAQAPKVDVTGAWESVIEGATTSAATYKQEGEKLTGTHVGQMGELPLSGTVKGNDITFTIAIEMEGQKLTLTYAGKVEGDTIKGTVDLGGMASATWTATRKK